MPTGFRPNFQLVAATRLRVQFIEGDADYRAVSVRLSVEQQRAGYDRSATQGAMAALDAIKHLPITGNVTKVISRGGASKRPALGRNGPVRRLAISA